MEATDFVIPQNSRDFPDDLYRGDQTETLCSPKIHHLFGRAVFTDERADKDVGVKYDSHGQAGFSACSAISWRTAC